MKYDFGGWATKHNLKCADGLTICKDAFKGCDGKKVPLVWNHQHNDPSKVLGHAVLENRDEGVYAYCNFNDTPKARDAKESVKHGDVESLSIWANNLTKAGSDVLHGVIREVSLVLAGANPGAFVESVMAHNMPMDDDEEEGIFYTGEGLQLAHADEPTKDKDDDEEEKNGETVGDIYKTLTDKQQKAVAIIVGQAIQDSKKESEEDEEEDENVKHNIFEGQVQAPTFDDFLSHDDMKTIVADAKKLGSMRSAVDAHLEEGGILAHAIDTTGMTTATGTQTYGFNDPAMLFPDPKAVTVQPEWISRNMTWVSKVMNSVHRTPFSRVKTIFADITEDEARAKGYIKGNQKKSEVFATLKRTTDPQTIYKLQQIDRDDVIDITDFDVIAWIKSEMQVMFDEEKARAILIGDGRPADSKDKIKEQHVRPVVTDVPLFNVTIVVEVAANATQAEIAKATIDAVIRSRKQYKGTGNPTFWTTDDVTTEMLLLEDKIGHKIYKTETELATTLRVNEIVPVEPMSGVTVDYKNEKLPLIGTVVNLVDYNVGADKGGQTSLFEDFDIDYNQMKYLIEGRMSGALIKPFSALTFLLKKGTTQPGSGEDDNQ